MEVLVQHIAKCCKATTAYSYLINRGQCNLSAITAKPISENHAIEPVNNHIDDTCKKR